MSEKEFLKKVSGIIDDIVEKLDGGRGALLAPLTGYIQGRIDTLKDTED